MKLKKLRFISFFVALMFILSACTSGNQKPISSSNTATSQSAEASTAQPVKKNIITDKNVTLTVMRGENPAQPILKYVSHSQDFGKTWSKAVVTNIPNNNSGIDLARLQDGRLVLVHNPVSGNWTARTPISFAVSEDNGNTWSEPVTLEHDPFDNTPKGSEFSYPAIITEQNEALITYTWKRKSIVF